MAAKAVILDDELHSIETLQWKLANYCPDVEIVASFDDPVEAVAYLRRMPPDLLFLDIEMPLLNGFDVLEELGEAVTFSVIFTTAYDQFGIQAIKCSALDYLLKPIQNKELQKAVDKYRQLAADSPQPADHIKGLLDNVAAEKAGRPARIGLATKESIEFVDPADIVLCASDNNYTMIYLVHGRKKLISRTLKDFETMLQPFDFFRTHNSYLVNLDEVKEFIRADGGYLIMSNNMKIPVTRSRRGELLEKLM